MTDRDGNPIVTARLSFSNWIALIGLVIGTGGGIAIGALKLWQDHEHRITVLEARQGIARTAGAALPLLALFLALGGCSAKAAISGAASTVQEAAHQTIELVSATAETGEPLSQSAARSVVGLQKEIIKAAITVQAKVVHVKDEPGILDRILAVLPWLAGVAALGLIVIVGARTGAFEIVGAFLKRLALRIRPTKAEESESGP